jgi:hypothetical protein
MFYFLNGGSLGMTCIANFIVAVEDRRIYDKGEYYDKEDKFSDPQRNVSSETTIKIETNDTAPDGSSIAEDVVVSRTDVNTNVEEIIPEEQ